MPETNTELHEARVLAEYGEEIEPYAQAQFLAKGFEAVGLPALSRWDRPVDEDGRVLDFDGRLMREKTRARLELPVAPFEHHRNRTEHMIQLLLDKLEPGQVVVVNSKHPDVSDDLAAIHGYSPWDRWLMKQVFRRTEKTLELYNYTIPHGSGREGITLHWGNSDTTIESELARHDEKAKAETGVEHFLGEVWTGGERDYTVIRARREEAEATVARHVVWYQDSLQQIGEAERIGWLDENEALEMKRRLERGFHTILLVELNPERARDELTAEDYEWMRTMLEFENQDLFAAAYDVAERNRLVFIACGGLSGPELYMQQEWYGAFKTVGRCVNCHEGPREIGEKGWCKGCINGHCGTR